MAECHPGSVWSFVVFAKNSPVVTRSAGSLVRWAGTELGGAKVTHSAWVGDHRPMTPRTPPPCGEMFHKQFECLNVKDCLTLGERDDYGSNAFHLLECCLHRW